MTNARKKGSRNERGVAKLFEDWTGFEFARTPQSGGLHWKKKNTVGDIVCIDEDHGREFKFSIECKFHAELNFSYLIDGTIGKKTNKVIEFWKQAEGDSIKVNKIPLLFMRRNGMKADMHFVAMPASFFWKLIEEVKSRSIKYGFILFYGKNIHLAIVNSEDLFTWEYNLIHIIAKDYLS